LRNRHLFPADVNRADRELLLRVPGLGARAVDRIVLARQHTTLRLADIARLTTGLKRARPFLVTLDHRPTQLTDRAGLRQRLVRPSPQADLFA
jgi:predicted DNA-binding helix-hairpin-helix protein